MDPSLLVRQRIFTTTQHAGFSAHARNPWKSTDNGSIPPNSSRVAAAPDAILLLDYDGSSLIPDPPEIAKPYPEVLTVLSNILRAGGTRVVIVSGRRAEELLRSCRSTGGGIWDRTAACVCSPTARCARRAEEHERSAWK